MALKLALSIWPGVRLFLYPGEYTFVLRIRVDVDINQDLFQLNILKAIMLILGCGMKKVSQLNYG